MTTETVLDGAVDAEGVVEFTRRLVRADTVAGPGRNGEAAAADLVSSLMQEWGWEPVTHEVAPGRFSVVATVEGGGGVGPTLGFEGHLDVVAEGSTEDWTRDPFGAEIVDGRLYGRGSADMKSGVAAMLYGTRSLQLAGPFPGAVRILCLADEEGLMLGAHHAVDSGLLKGVDGVICCEPEGGEVCPTSKGAVRIQVRFQGAMAHGAMPEQGRNPLPALGRFLVAIESLQSDLQDQHQPHPHLGKVYVTPTVTACGTPAQMNSISSTSTVWIDVRTIPGVDHPQLIAEVSRLANEAGGEDLKASVEILVDRPPVDTPISDPLVDCLIQAHSEVCGQAPAEGGVPGTTDGTVITNWGGVPSVVYGPGGKWIAHQADEWVSVDEIPLYATVYASAARRFLEASR